MYRLIIAVLLAALANVAAADVVYQFDLAYAANRIVSFEMAARGSDRFRAMPIKSQDASGSVTVAIRRGQGDCVRDLRIGFADGRRVVRRDFDVCKLAAVRAGESLLLAAQP